MITDDAVEWQELHALLSPPPTSNSSSSLAVDLLGQLSWPADPVTSHAGDPGTLVKNEETAAPHKPEAGRASGDTATGLSLPANLTLAMSASQVVATCKGLGL